MEPVETLRSLPLQSDEPTNFLLIGNPGSGKSTILNGLARQVVFKSGISWGRGLTTGLDTHVIRPHTLMDTPGLADPKLRQQAALAITEALRHGGVFKIFFVVVLQNGRVRSEDVTTMKLVLDAAPIAQYGVIINQVKKAEFAELTTTRAPDAPGASAIERVMECLFHGMQPGRVTFLVHLVKMDDQLDGEPNVFKELPPDLEAFMATTPSIPIATLQVQEVQAEEFEASARHFEDVMSALRDGNARLSELVQQRGDECVHMRRQLEEQQAAMRTVHERQVEKYTRELSTLRGATTASDPRTMAHILHLEEKIADLERRISKPGPIMEILADCLDVMTKPLIALRSAIKGR